MRHSKKYMMCPNADNCRINPNCSHRFKHEYKFGFCDQVADCPACIPYVEKQDPEEMITIQISRKAFDKLLKNATIKVEIK